MIRTLRFIGGFMSKQNTILLVDDDPKITELTKKFLENYHFKVFCAAHGQNLFRFLQEEEIDLIVLDIMLPGQDGFELCRKIRAEKNLIPIIMLTAVSEETDRILGIEIGADDYLTKPFNPRELLARVKAIFRRAQTGYKSKNKQYFFNQWMLDQTSRSLTSPEKMNVSLTDGEYRLLETLVLNAQKILTRDFLLDTVENREAGPFDRSIDVRISRLRQKLGDDPKEPQLIKTIRSGGYLFAAEVTHGE